MDILFLDTSGAEGKAAWYGENSQRQAEHRFELGNDTGRRVLAAAAALVAAHGVPAAVAVCAGIGQRTGALRAGMTAAQALAWSWGVPLAEVPPGADPAAFFPGAREKGRTQFS